MISVLGVTETIAKFLALEARTVPALELGKKTLAEEVQTYAVENHPWDNVTGETEASIQVTEEGVVAGGAIGFLEFGTSKMAARPTLRPAADSADGHVAEVAMEAVIL